MESSSNSKTAEEEEERSSSLAAQEMGGRQNTIAKPRGASNLALISPINLNQVPKA